ncbi:CapA family protein [Thalassotalea psychrophila]|uniref:CapA family protein n=1 Tax=Thalassotalea psychrophila TaxID=3065647 RepID=A0ABY9TPA8_9GAMM|nr:CapA family protein [Colwelliaceae bacterium SQ149]
MRFYLMILLFLSFGFAVNAAESITIEGRLLSEDNQPINGVEVHSANKTVLTDQQGQYSLKLPNADIYQMTFSKDGLYQSVQSFSHYELRANENNQATIADITLVDKKAKRVMFAFGGDVMMGRRYYQPKFGDAVLISDENRLSDSKAIVEHVKPYMSLADFAAVNLETQVSETLPGERAPKSVTFYSKPEILEALAWAGIDYVTLGNNHTYDYMDSGLKSTLEHLNNSKLDFSGAGLNESEALTAHHTKINDNDFAMLGYVGWEGRITPKQTASEDQGGAAFGSLTNIVNSVSREVSNDKVTFVQYHGSQEYSTGPTGVTEQRLKSAIDSGASLAVAHHPHVTQGLELYNGKLIAYSMGNFVFDQYFTSTPHSFILYVWMDGDSFHRAEIVPLYLKGYMPTPATGMHRFNSMKRLVTLSNERGTHIGVSGGHGVITAENKVVESPNTEFTLNFANNTRVQSLSHLPWANNINKVDLPESTLSYRLGVNLINGSDFESFNTFTSNERGFVLDREHSKLNNYGASGQKSMALTLAKDKPSIFGMQSFRRVYKASSPMTIKANLKASTSVKVNFYWQGRSTKQSTNDALANGKKNLIKSITLNANKQWQAVEVDFNSPRVGYKSYRILAEFVLADGSTGQVDLDDFALIEWQSAFSSASKPQLLNIGRKQASFIGLNHPTDKTIIIKN